MTYDCQNVTEYVLALDQNDVGKSTQIIWEKDKKNLFEKVKMDEVNVARVTGIDSPKIVSTTFFSFLNVTFLFKNQCS